MNLIGKRIVNIIKDGNYLIFEFEDHSLFPVINMISDLGKNYILNKKKNVYFVKVIKK